MSSPKVVIAVEAGEWPAEAALEELARQAVDAAGAALGPGHTLPRDAEISLLFTDDAAMRKLNARWRGKDSSTNVLSFPQSASPLLGDVIFAAETLRREATLADKPLEEHMLHLIIHGYLHLLGFDHEAEADAEEMERLERVALKTLGIEDPYATAS